MVHSTVVSVHEANTSPTIRSGHRKAFVNSFWYLAGVSVTVLARSRPRRPGSRLCPGPGVSWLVWRCSCRPSPAGVRAVTLVWFYVLDVH